MCLYGTEEGLIFLRTKRNTQLSNFNSSVRCYLLPSARKYVMIMFLQIRTSQCNFFKEIQLFSSTADGMDVRPFCVTVLCK
jgi:hypothetical protein